MRAAGRAVPWVLLAALSAAYMLKPDGAAALTIFPAWTWLPFGIVPALFWLRRDRRSAGLLFGASLIYGLAFSEEWRSLIRLGVEEARSPGTIRIVSLNCAGGTFEAAKEVAAMRPDIVFLQESPSSVEVVELARILFGAEGRCVTGPDASIIARAPLEALPLPRGTHDFVAASTRLDDQSVILVSLRLMPPTFRIDLINPSAWSDLAANRVARREEIAGIARFLPGGPTIMGGDFNCQSGDRALDAMPASLRDTFYEAGRGWCHSAVNDYPLARIDQIWTSGEFAATQLFARKTVFSDHRMVVCDLRALPRPAEKKQ